MGNRLLLPKERKKNQLKEVLNNYKYGPKIQKKGTGFAHMRLKCPDLVDSLSN